MLTETLYICWLSVIIILRIAPHTLYEYPSVVKTPFTVPTDAHCYKNHRMLKQFKIITLAPTCFGSRRSHHQGAVLCLAKSTEVLVGIDAVSVMATYQPVVQV